MPRHEDRGSEEDKNASRKGKEERNGGRELRKEGRGKPRAGRRAFVPPSLLQRRSTSQRGGVHPTHRLVWPSRRERAVCIPHTALFNLFDPPHRLGGFFPATARTRQREVHTPPRSSSIIPPYCGGEFLFKRGRVNPTGGPRSFAVSNGGDIHASPPFLSVSNGAA
jgi:hypothetical protein